MIIRSSVILLFVGLAGCTTDRVTTELDQLSSVIRSANATIIPALKPDLEQDRIDTIADAASAGDSWFLSDDCPQFLYGVAGVPLENCVITKVTFGDREPYIGLATATKRKLETLSLYLLSLEALADSKLEAEVTQNYAAALGAFSSLNSSIDNANLTAFLHDRSAKKEKTDAVISAAISTLRYNRMKSVVLRSNASVVTLVREIQDNLILLDFDKGYSDRVDKLQELNNAALSIDPVSEPKAYEASLLALESGHAEFIKYVKTTQIYKIGLIARVHSELADALESSGSTEDMLSYLESLRELADIVKG